MIDLNSFMKKVGVTKKSYVRDWISDDLIPGVMKAPDIESTMFPASARRPYKERNKLRATSNSPAIRTHIVKAALNRTHITKEMCHLTTGEFEGFIDELIEAELIRRRVEDDITYYDSTIKSNICKEKSFNNLRKFILEALEVSSKGAAEGFTKAILDKTA